MFSAHTESLRKEVDGLVKVLLKHEQIRSLVWQIPSPTGTEPDPLAEIRGAAPDSVIWKVYDHSAAYTRLYALFERFVYDVVEEWLVLLPELYGHYSNLPESVRTCHRVGVGQILSKLGGDQYERLSEEIVLKGISEGVIGKAQYTFLPDAFYTEVQNLWPGVLASLFRKVGIDDTWGWINKHRSVVEFLKDFRGNESTPESELKNIVHYRNLAAHGDIGEVVSVADFVKVARFIVAISESLSELVMSNVINRRRSMGYIEELGSVIHSFSGDVAGVKASGSKFEMHDTIVVFRKRVCYYAEVMGIEVKNVPYHNVTPKLGQEIGLKLSRAATVGSKLFRLLKAPNTTLVPVAETEETPETLG